MLTTITPGGILEILDGEHPKTPKILNILENGPMSKGFSSEKQTHVQGFLVKKRQIGAAHPRVALIREYPPPRDNNIY